MSSSSTTASAPGKVLLAGGYLVLESPNPGWVVAADKRFYTTVVQQATKNIQDTKIIVTSPQFHASWEYEWDVITRNDDDADDDHEWFHLTAANANASENPFVEKTLTVVLGYLHAKDVQISGGLKIIIQADNDFYSILPHLASSSTGADTKVVMDQVDGLPPCLPCPKDPDTGKAIVNKTGLGSSAALTTSLVAALMEHFLPSDSKSNKDRRIHNLSQICHCSAQGKIGSGFDVSAAMVGSHIYRRFPKCILSDLLQELAQEASLSRATQNLLTSVVETSWSNEDDDDEEEEDQEEMKESRVQPLALPYGLQIILADVCGGSESPSMARKVMAWKQQQAIKGKIPHWDDLKEINGQIIKFVQALGTLPPTWNVELLAQKTPAEWKEFASTTSNGDDPTHQAAHLLADLHESFQHARFHLRSLGQAVDVPIEPPEQTELCDGTLGCSPGIVSAVVPGAGGYDAVACLYLDTLQTRQAIGNFWAAYHQQGQKATVCPLAVRATREGWRTEPSGPPARPAS